MDRDWLTGRRGQALALAVTLLLALAVWSAVAAPLLSWYADRAETLAQRQTLADRMATLAASWPSLQRQAEARTGGPVPASVTLGGGSDAVVGATLQERLQAMATAAGAALTSVETLPAEPAGAWRRIGLRVSLTTPWPVLIRLLQAIGQATPQMLVDDLRVQATIVVNRPGERPLQTSLTVMAFRAGAPAAASPP